MRASSHMRQKWLRTLVAFVTLFVAVISAAQEPVKIQAVRRAFRDAYLHEDWERAAEIGLELVEMAPRPGEKYNLACVYACAGDVTSALFWLEKAAASGFYRLALLESDSDLDIVRDAAGYAKVRVQIEVNLAGIRALATEEISSTPPLTVMPKGKDIHGPRPLIIALHGYGDSAKNYPAAWGPAAKEIGAILVLPQGAAKIGQGRGWIDVELADAIVLWTIDYARENLEVDWDRVVLTGFSEGGFMAMAIGVRHPHLFAGVIPMAGGYIPSIDAPPKAREGDPRYYFMVGSHDGAAERVRLAAADFEAAGYEVDLRILLGTGHSFPRARKQELGKALRFVLEE